MYLMGYLHLPRPRTTDGGRRGDVSETGSVGLLGAAVEGARFAGGAAPGEGGGAL